MTKTYSLPQIWSLDAKALNDSVSEELIEPLPVSADAWARARYRARCAGLKWEEPTVVLVLNAAADEPRPERREQLRDEYRAAAALEPTC